MRDRGEDATGVDPSDVRQGFIGDCFSLSPLMATAALSPRRIANMVRGPIGESPSGGDALRGASCYDSDGRRVADHSTTASCRRRRLDATRSRRLAARADCGCAARRAWATPRGASTHGLGLASRLRRDRPGSTGHRRRVAGRLQIWQARRSRSQQPAIAPPRSGRPPAAIADPGSHDVASDDARPPHRVADPTALDARSAGLPHDLRPVPRPHESMRRGSSSTSRAEPGRRPLGRRRQHLVRSRSARPSRAAHHRRRGRRWPSSRAASSESRRQPCGCELVEDPVRPARESADALKTDAHRGR